MQPFPKPIQIVVYEDVLCAWCYLMEPRLQTLRSEFRELVRWKTRPFPLRLGEKRPTAAELKWQRALEKAENKARAKIIACVDKNVRAASWPPSSRRDSFTTEI